VEKSEIRQLLMELPLAKAVQQIMSSNAPTSLQQQIDALEKELEGPITAAIRAPLTEALAQMKEARRQANRPLQAAIVREVHRILEQEGLSTDEQPRRHGFSGGSGYPVDSEALRRKVLSVLPENPSEGLSGSALAKECGLCYSALKKRLNAFAAEGLIVREGAGNRTIWRRK